MTKVLVCGHRTGLAQALEAQGVPFCIWHDKPVLRPGAAQAVFVHDFPRRKEDVQTALVQFPAASGTTHVIAGAEAAVLTSSLLRRLLGARKAPHTVALRCHDKLFMKTAASSLGVPMTDFVDGDVALRDPESLRRLGSPVVVKERGQSGGRGMEIVENPPTRWVRLRGRLVERFVDAPEISVESFVSRQQIRFQNITEYVRKRHVNVVPAELPQAVRERVLELNRRTIEGLRIQWGMTHTEWYLTPGGPLFGELALRPPGGYIMELISEAYGFNAWEAYVSVELDRAVSFPEAARSHAAAVLYYPGPGRIARVSGVAAVRKLPEVFAARVKARAGDLLGERTGAAHEVGHILLRAENRSRLLAALQVVESRLTIEMQPLHEP